MTRIHLGIDVFLEHPSLSRNVRVALLTNYAAATRNGERTADALLAICEIKRMFAPEHGFWGDVAYLEDVDSDDYRGIPVESLYGIQTSAALAPRLDQLRDIDVLLVDLQDIGARYFTYAATLGNCMSVAAQTRTRVVVLDRPNPINGCDVEGNVNFARPFMSFVGQYPLPNRHALTIGEIAQFINAIQRPACDLEVVPMRGWKRSMWWNETELDWIHPSPNMATPETALLYPGTCLFEGTNLSEGRGTTHPFELIGAPWLDEQRLASMLNALAIGGAQFQPFCFRPAFNKHAGERCHGVFIRVTDRNAFHPVRTAMLTLKLMRDLHPREFRWYDSFYEYATVPAIDTLTGSSDFREIVEDGTVADLEEWISDAEQRRLLIEPERQKALIAGYDDTPRVAIPLTSDVTDVPSDIGIPLADA